MLLRFLKRSKSSFAYMFFSDCTKWYFFERVGRRFILPYQDEYLKKKKKNTRPGYGNEICL